MSDKRMYIRFVVGSDGEDHRYLTGVVTEARLLRDEGCLDVHEIEWLEEVFEWFNENVPVPPYSLNDWPDDVAAWFKSNANPETIGRIWDLIALLREHGRRVRILRSKAP
ncbi:MAG: hypothetical protein KDA63_04465, partial [Planctomycetales bacterium]|nr:hypothetical protein [Planctomycetales bacterium]